MALIKLTRVKTSDGTAKDFIRNGGDHLLKVYEVGYTITNSDIAGFTEVIAETEELAENLCKRQFGYVVRIDYINDISYKFPKAQALFIAIESLYNSAERFVIEGGVK